MKLLNFWPGSILVSPSANIWADGVYLTLNCLFWNACLPQQLWISTCLSLVWMRGVSLVISLIVCKLSHSITGNWSSCRPIWLNSRWVPIASFAVCVKARSSASVDEVVTVSCLPAFQETGPPNSDIIEPWDDRLVSWSSANAASEAICRSFLCSTCTAVSDCPLYWIARCLVANR